MDVGSRNSYPAGALSNFSPHPFEIDGVYCASMEGFLQSLKFKNPDMQKEVCKLVGFGAKNRGAKKGWKRNQILYWNGQEYPRKSQYYQDLLDRAYDALAKNTKFKKALLATHNANLTHSIGKNKVQDTVLTEREFCSRLIMKLRTQLQNEQDI
jgi:predicted NAD-dependent protein-ADP-ribosyltransferase YbiA (DUF1768 family)